MNVLNLLGFLVLASTVPLALGEGAGLQAYEGLFEYEGGSTVELAVSAKDHRLYALLDGSKYLLRHVEGDRFLNVQDVAVVFLRDEKGHVTGYRVGETATVMKRLRDDLPNPESRWFARKPNADGTIAADYQPPPDLNDGLPVADLSGVPINQAQVKAWVQAVASGEYDRVHSILLVADGHLVVEAYFYQYDRETLHQMRSATKSVVALLVGLALARGDLNSLDQPVVSFFPEYGIQNRPPLKERITLRHLLTQTSGLACNDWDGDSPGNETKMGVSGDWVKFILDLPMEAEPGVKGSYCSGGVILLGRMVEKATGMPLAGFAKQFLFDPLGIESFRWRFVPDASSANTFCQLYLRPRDMVKLGMLVANQGRWKDRQVVPATWIQAMSGKYSRLDDTEYGYLWWHKWIGMNGKRYDALTATGNGGQKIQIWKDLDLLTVFTGGNYNQSSPVNAMLGRFVLPLWK